MSTFSTCLHGNMLFLQYIKIKDGTNWKELHLNLAIETHSDLVVCVEFLVSVNFNETLYITW